MKNVVLIISLMLMSKVKIIYAEYLKGIANFIETRFVYLVLLTVSFIQEFGCINVNQAVHVS